MDKYLAAKRKQCRIRQALALAQLQTILKRCMHNKEYVKRRKAKIDFYMMVQCAMKLQFKRRIRKFGSFELKQRNYIRGAFSSTQFMIMPSSQTEAKKAILLALEKRKFCIDF